MTIFNRVLNGQIVSIRADTAFVGGVPPVLHPNKGVWLPRVVENESFDPVTQVREGPEIIIEEDQVREVYTVRDKDSSEIAAMKTALVRAIRREEVRRVQAAMDGGKFFAMVTLGFMGMIASGSLDRAAWNAQVRNSFNPLYDIARTTLIAIHSAAVTKEAEASALTTAAEIAAYDINAGWP